MKEQYDEKQGYCRMLGHTLSFRYCRVMHTGLPCHNILNCWFERFDIEAFVGENYSTEELLDIFTPPRKKMETIVEVVNQAAAGISVQPEVQQNGDDSSGKEKD